MRSHSWRDSSDIIDSIDSSDISNSSDSSDQKNFFHKKTVFNRKLYIFITKKTSSHKKIMQSLHTKNHTTASHKKSRNKNIMQPLRQKNHATSRK